MNRLVIPRWDAWMSNRSTAADFFESWLAVQLRNKPACDMIYQLLQFLERTFQGGLQCCGEDHRDLFKNVDFSMDDRYLIIQFDHTYTYGHFQ